jgi:hypothetical protein
MPYLAMFIALSAPACRSNRNSRRDASTSAPLIEVKSNLVDWKTACGLANDIGLPAITSPPILHMREVGGAIYICGSLAARNGPYFEAWGSTLKGAYLVRLRAPTGVPGKPDMDPRRMLPFADKLTEKIIGQPVPSVLRRTLLTSGNQTVTLGGWHLRAFAIPAKDACDYTMYLLSKPPHRRTNRP